MRRLLHMSALGADSAGASMYQRSKGDGEAAVRKELEGWRDGGWTIFRPSVVFGPDDNFTNLFARLARWLPVLLAGAHARMQPVYVGDVVAAMTAALDDTHACGKTYELGGPQVYAGRDRAPVRRLERASASGLAHADGPGPPAGAVFECLPGEPLMSRDNLDSLRSDNVVPDRWRPSCEWCRPGWKRWRPAICSAAAGAGRDVSAPAP